ncbi:MAG: hypothetical protein IJA26_00150 [Clostridia bacterium]|nr:hypothetical protein [Clostridia bacterium]
MKRIISLILIAATLLLGVSAFAESANHSLVPVDDVHWGDTRNELISKLGLAFAGNDESSLIDFIEIGGLNYSAVYRFEKGSLSDITVFTDAIGKEEYRETCADIYDALIAAITETYGADAEVKTNDRWKSDTAKAQYENGNLSIPMWEGDLTRSCTISTESATASVLFTLSGNSLNIGFVVEPNEPDTGIWIMRAYVDEFDMPTDDYFIVSSELTGKFSNSATTGSKLTAYIFCNEFSDSPKEYIKIRLFEYDSYQVNNPYSDGKFYDVTMMDGAGTKHYLEGWIPSKGADIRVYDEDAQTIISALKAGGTVRFAIVPSEKSQDKYSFNIEDASGFDTIFDMWKAK